MMKINNHVADFPDKVKTTNTKEPTEVMHITLNTYRPTEVYINSEYIPTGGVGRGRGCRQALAVHAVSRTAT